MQSVIKNNRLHIYHYMDQVAETEIQQDKTKLLLQLCQQMDKVAESASLQYKKKFFFAIISARCHASPTLY